jgi:hypothetical protein
MKRIPGDQIKVTHMTDLNPQELVEYAKIGLSALQRQQSRDRFASKLLRVVAVGYDTAAEQGHVNETIDFMLAQSLIGEIISDKLYGNDFRNFKS